MTWKINYRWYLIFSLLFTVLCIVLQHLLFVKESDQIKTLITRKRLNTNDLVDFIWTKKHFIVTALDLVTSRQTHKEYINQKSHRSSCFHIPRFVIKKRTRETPICHTRYVQCWGAFKKLLCSYISTSICWCICDKI